MLKQIAVASLLIALFALVRIVSDRYIVKWRARQSAEGRSDCMSTGCGGCSDERQEHKTRS